jgi:ubiquinone/menaquinone biosynthesis C-methylase UbiE
MKQPKNVLLLLNGALALTVVACLLPCGAQQGPDYDKNERKPEDGTARQTAQVWKGSPLGPGGAFEDPGRANQLRIEEVMDMMGLKAGSVVADVGAGGGWFSMLAAKRVGEKGTVYAQEINPEYTRFIENRATNAGYKNVKAILGTYDDPKLPENKMDAVLILNAYHEFEQPLAMLRKIKTAMKPGGRLAFIERDTDQLRQDAETAYAQTGKIKRRVTEQNDDNPRTDDHRLAMTVIEREAATAGFKKYKSLELNDDHYLLVVEKPTEEKPEEKKE